MMNDVRLSRMTVLAELMAATALFAACGGGPVEEPTATAGDADGLATPPAVKDATVGSAERRPTWVVKSVTYNKL